jgi:peptide/nickel transport system substrate-binding protein
MRATTVKPGWVAVALALGLATAGCGGKPGVAGSAYLDPYPLPRDTLTVPVREIGTYGGRFVIAATSGPKTFNAIMANETSSSDISDRLFAGLTDIDNLTQAYVPLLARSWDVSADGLTWTWHLRRGARFSDGHPLTSDDVLFSFQVAYDDSLHPSIQDLLKIKGRRFEVSAPDSYTVVTKIAMPYALMIPAVGSLKIMPRHILEAAHRAGAFAATYAVSMNPDRVVTSGPWRLKQYVPGEKTVLTRNPHWVGVDPQGRRLPYLEELVFLIVPDQEGADLKFRAGEVDGLDNVKPENYRWYEEHQKDGNFTLYDLGPSLTSNFFWFNLNRVRDGGTGKPPGSPCVDPVKYSWFSNRSFRRAISKAIDRDAMIRSVFFGDAEKNWSSLTVADRVWQAAGVRHDDYDPEGAKRLLANLGWKDTNRDGYLEDGKGHTVSFTMKTNSDNRTRGAMMNFIQDDLRKIGVRCVPTPVDFNTLISNLRQDFQYESMLLGLGSAVPPDPGMAQNFYRSSGLTHYWNIKQPRPETPAEARIDRLIEQNVTTMDMETRQRTWAEIQNALNDECFVVWLPVLRAKLPVRNGFGNFRPSIIPHRLLWNIEQVFAKPRAARA